MRCAWAAQTLLQRAWADMPRDHGAMVGEVAHPPFAYVEGLVCSGIDDSND